jgi:hypothetical protein
MGKGGVVRQHGEARRASFGVSAVGAALAAVGVMLVTGCASNVPGDDTSMGMHSPTSGTAVGPGSGSGAESGTNVGMGQAYTQAGGTFCPTTSADPAFDKLKAVTSDSTLPADFGTVEVVRCRSEVRTVPGDGEWNVDVAERATTGYSAFLGLLRESDESTPTGAPVACTADMLLVPDFGLVGKDGTVIRPKLPLTFCGKPRPEVLTALNDLPWSTVATAKDTQVATEGEVETGCPGAYKYLPNIELQTKQPWATERHPAVPATTVACVFRVEGNGMNAVGQFVSGVVLTPAQGAAVDSAIGTASQTPAPACSTQATRFVMLGNREGVGAYMSYLVELDGCKRLLLPNEYPVSAPAKLVAALASDGVS